jgi:hypothetical protein
MHPPRGERRAAAVGGLLTRACTPRHVGCHASAGLSIGQENMVKELVKVRDDLQVSPRTTTTERLWAGLAWPCLAS